MQTNGKNVQSLSDAGLSPLESQSLLAEITKQNDQYRIKFKDDTQAMDCIFYWDPSDIQLARRFCQVIQVDSTFSDNIWRLPLLEITAMTNQMNTFLIVQALILLESAESLLWVFEQVCTCTRLTHETR